jgi:hypothetical protein
MSPPVAAKTAWLRWGQVPADWLPSAGPPRRHCQRPYSGAVEERHPGQVQDQPLGPVIDGQGRLSQEPASLGKAQVAAQDEGTDGSIADGLDREGMLTHGFPIGSRGLDDTN